MAVSRTITNPFGGGRLIGFAVIWSALAVYSLEGLWQAWMVNCNDFGHCWRCDHEQNDEYFFIWRVLAS